MLIDVRHLNRYVNKDELEQYKTAQALATAAIEHAKINTDTPLYSLYVALTHIASIPEMEVSLPHYDALLYTECHEIPKDILDEVEELMQKLELVIAKKVVAAGV